MADEQEIRGSHEEVEGFVAKLRDFHGSLGESEQAMLETIVESAQSQDTGAYAMRIKFSARAEAGRIWSAGWRARAKRTRRGSLLRERSKLGRTLGRIG
jgi:hypothetical protein